VATSRIADSVGRVLGDRYRLTRPLGVGASAHVYAAEDVRLRRRVAVKVLHPALAGEEAFLRRFRREAQAVASLRHPNILRVYDWGEDSGSPYLVMELLEGGSLRALLDRGVLLSPAQAAAVGADAARALDYAHRQGLVHRDIKPANLLFDEEGRVSVADFGLARALAEATWTEPAGAVVGTARYASPELVRGEHLDSKADVYSLALVLVEALTGTVPFVADTAFGTLMARVGRPLEVPEEAGPLKELLAAAGAADPADRIDAGALARGLDSISNSLPFPAPLPLAGPLTSDLVERDDVSPTEFPGRTRLFDRAEWEDDDAPLPAAAVPAAAAAAATPVREGAADDGDTGRGGDGGARRPRRSRRVVLAVVAALVLLAGGGAAWAVVSGRLQPLEPVPALAGLNQAQATTALGREHLKLAVTATVYSSARPAGAVVSQSPLPGRKVRRDGAVHVVLSAGPAPVPVPAVGGDQLQAAEQALHSVGLRWTVTQATSMTVPAGAVISAQPDSGTLVPGRSVALVVSTGKPTRPVPAITAGSETGPQAKAALAAAGFAVAETQDWSNTIKAGDVISVSPSPGTPVVVGGTVTVDVSKGPHYVLVPPTQGMSVGDADSALTAAGLTVSGVTGNPLNSVRGTDPGAGTQVLYGASVVIVTK
jgi:beta-lactam-binding protein with PASTA domain/tRNA A-37 threonylcarbamoyl transferase component Bud32